MILDAMPFSESSAGNASDVRGKALRSLTNLIERKLGVSVVYDLRTLPYGRADLVEIWKLGDTLKEHGIIKSLYPSDSRLPDEPPLCVWTATYNDTDGQLAAGATPADDLQALRATLSEALERYIWSSEIDHFVNPVHATAGAIGRYGRYIAPQQFAGFSETQRQGVRTRMLRDEAEYLWVQGTSLVSGAPTYIPVQTVSGYRGHPLMHDEPLMRQRTTIGLATWPTTVGARLAGALEVIEREAYMIMWLNQLSLPRLALEPILEKNAALSKFIASLRRYRLRPHIVRLVTDAPTYAICAVIEDESGSEPRFAVGLKAHRSLEAAIEKALTEALRARHGYRTYSIAGNRWDMTTPVENIGHRDRMYYWGLPENSHKLEFLIKGPLANAAPEAWDNDSPADQLKSVIEWCKTKGFECVSVPLGKSKRNPTQLAIEMVVIPELVPSHLEEKYRAFGSGRISSVPKEFGYAPAAEPFIAAPHPFS